MKIAINGFWVSCFLIYFLFSGFVLAGTSFDWAISYNWNNIEVLSKNIYDFSLNTTKAGVYKWPGGPAYGDVYKGSLNNSVIVTGHFLGVSGNSTQFDSWPRDDHYFVVIYDINNIDILKIRSWFQNGSGYPPNHWGIIEFDVGGKEVPLYTKAAELAKELINQPYLWGGKGWDYYQDLFVPLNTVKSGYNFYNPSSKSASAGVGVDCSGLIMWSFNRSFDPLKSRFNNFVKAEGADGQYRYNTASTTEAELKPGDVMFFDFTSTDGPNHIDHVAMYVGESGGFDVVSARNVDLGIVKATKDNLKQEPGFVAFRQVVSAASPAILATAHSPVDLILTDPDGFTITPTTIIPFGTEYLREISGVLYYSEIEKGTDGNPIDQIYSYTAKTGDYIIKVIPATGALPTETYTLDFKVGEQTTVLAQNVPLSQIPNQGYGVTVSTSGIANSFIPVAIDIKPSSYPNNINLGSNGVVPVAILGSATFDVRQIDSTTIKLENASIKLKNNGQLMVSYEDVNNDLFTDIAVHIITKDLQLTSVDIWANLEGRLADGTMIKGLDSVRIIP